MGDHIYLTAMQPGVLTADTVADAVSNRWPKVDLYPAGENGNRRLGFFALVDGSEVDCTFFEARQFVAVDLGEPGAAFLEWFLRLAPDNVQWVVYTEQETDPVAVSARASARDLLKAVRWPGKI